MATATRELVNPYSKLGLKRRPTYDEITGSFNENDLITGRLADRTATCFEASPEGSFFGGSDALEVFEGATKQNNEAADEGYINETECKTKWTNI